MSEDGREHLCKCALSPGWDRTMDSEEPAFKKGLATESEPDIRS